MVVIIIHNACRMFLLRLQKIYPAVLIGMASPLMESTTTNQEFNLQFDDYSHQNLSNRNTCQYLTLSQQAIKSTIERITQFQVTNFI